MNETKVNTFFVSEKISKIRWVPEQYKDSERFLTGSWDAPTNFIKMWHLGNQYSEEYNECVPKCIDKVSFDGDINCLEILSSGSVAVCTSDGYVSILNVKRVNEEDTLRISGRSERLHKFNSGKSAPCTGLSIFGKDIATIGEDGKLNIIESSNLSVVKSIEADSCALTAVCYVNPKEILIANRMGVINMFDIRSSGDKEPTASFMISCEDDRKSNYVSCLAYHPTQKHIVLSGSEEGAITVWDLRQPGFPASYLNAHTSSITEIGFHKMDPSKLFTSAEGGELWQWRQNSMIIPSGMEPETSRPDSDNINPWLNGERTKNRINVTSLITGLRKSINSFDSHGSKIICGSDSEAIYLIDSFI